MANKDIQHTPLTLFEENGHSYSDYLSPHIIRGPYKTILKFLSRKQFETHIGGYVLWEPPMLHDSRMRGGSIGVYGNREVPKFKQALRDAGANFTVIKESGPKQMVAHVHNTKKFASIYPVLNGDIFKQRFVYGNKFMESIFWDKSRKRYLIEAQNEPDSVPRP